MWMIHTQHQESEPTTTLRFSPLKSVPLSLNSYSALQPNHAADEQVEGD